MKRTTMKCHGKKGGGTSPLASIFNAQMCFQNMITGMRRPIDDYKLFQYHVTGMMEELGEVLKADKRWKSHRNTKYDPTNKLEEIADVFITAINIALYSGFSDIDVFEMIMFKIALNENKLRLED